MCRKELVEGLGMGFFVKERDDLLVLVDGLVEPWGIEGRWDWGDGVEGFG